MVGLSRVFEIYEHPGSQGWRLRVETCLDEHLNPTTPCGFFNREEEQLLRWKYEA